MNIVDATHSLGFLFLGAAPPPPPFGLCGPDPSRDALGCVAFTGCEPPPPGPDRIFGEAASYSLHCLPTDIALGDFDGDHAIDIAAPNWGGGGDSPVSILLGAGDGTFAAAANYSAGFRSQAIAIGDLNADGVLDLAVANGDGQDVSILLGGGDARFGQAVHYPAIVGPFSVALGDLDGDGALDLAVGTYNGYVLILLGAGDGTFDGAVGYGVASIVWVERR